MKMKTIALMLMTLVAVSAAHSQDKPALERGKSFIVTPAISNGLCVSNLFQSGMVLQRDKPVAIWGWAGAGEKITVSINGRKVETKATEDRSWKVNLPAMSANADGQTMTITGKETTITLTDVLVGDVWILGGQSNMEFPISKVVDGDLEVASAKFPKIRHITVPPDQGPEYKKSFARQYFWHAFSHTHRKAGFWETCSPETVQDLSAIGYVFARRIHMASQVPIGVVDASRGGTTVETWTPRTVLDQIDAPETKAMLATWDAKIAAYDPEESLKERIAKHAAWVERTKAQGKPVNKPVPTEPGKDPAKMGNNPGNSFAGMIAPLAGLSVKGAIFHQGYNNCFGGTAGAKMYYQVFGRMITAWRSAFNDPQMPFGIISLCTATAPQDQNDYVSRMVDTGPEIREAQYRTFLDFREAGDETIGFASSFDQRHASFHPGIKAPVGERIARWALASQYGMTVGWEPPMCTEVKVEDGAIRLVLSQKVSAHDKGPIYGFAIAGEDKRFHPAKAEFGSMGKDKRGRPKRDQKQLVLSSPLVPKPIHFRYAWARNPQANLKAKEIPFATQRSDTWTMEELYGAYTGKQPADPEAGLNIREIRDLKTAMSYSDRERRVFELKQLTITEAK